MPLRPAAALLAAALAACGSSAKTDPNIEKPFTGWIGVQGMRCADGSATGIGILPGRSDAVLVYLAGGGACWGPGTCSPSVPRSFGEADFANLMGSPLRLYAGTIFDRDLGSNPFATWTLVYVPYCTGDVHAGDNTAVHGVESWDHHGWKNLEAAVGALTTDLAARPRQLVVAGSSAGGFGALAAYDLLRGIWDPAGGTTAALLDDSGPTFVGTATPPDLLAAWWDSWGLGSTLGALCGADCAPPGQGGRGDLSAIWTAIHGRHPADRLALVSTTTDAVMRAFFADPPGVQMAPGVFRSNLAALAQRLQQLPNVATYVVDGDAYQDHAILARTSLGTTFLQSPQGPPLLAWVSQLVSLDPAWASSTSQ